MRKEFSGKIKFLNIGDHHKLYLIQQDGSYIDLAGRTSELSLQYPDKKFQVNYWVANENCSKEEAIQNVLMNFYGKEVSESYTSEDNGSMGSSMTGWMSCVEHESALIFGGHNILNELSNREGKFLIIEFNIGNQ